MKTTLMACRGNSETIWNAFRMGNLMLEKSISTAWGKDTTRGPSKSIFTNASQKVNAL